MNLPGAYIFPSKDNELIQNTLSGLVQKFVELVQYKNGLLCFELIKCNGSIFIIEAQFRFGAKFQEVFLKNEFGIDELEMLLTHALTGKLEGYKLPISSHFKQSYALMNILLRKGIIKKIQPYEDILKFPQVMSYIPMRSEGVEILPDGSMVQMFGKVSFSAKSRNSLLSSMRFFQNHIQIIDEDNQNMVIKSVPDFFC